VNSKRTTRRHMPENGTLFLTVSGRPESVIVPIGMMHCQQNDSTISLVCDEDPLSRLLVHGMKMLSIDRNIAMEAL
jgi:hypothetical protein